MRIRRAAAMVAGGALVAASLMAVPPAQAAQGDVTRVSVSSSGGQANGPSSDPTVSADGRFIAFTSSASNLVSGDTNNATDVFVRDLVNRTTARVSVGASGGQGNGASSSPSISSDGRYVAFSSAASNLVAGDSNAAGDVFVRDLQSATTTRVSVGAGVSGSSGSPGLAGNGKVVAFTSAARKVIVRDLTTGTNTTIDSGASPVLSWDGRYAAWISDNAGAARTYDRQTKQTTTVEEPVFTEGLRNPTISGDGRFVAYVSEATTLGGVWRDLTVWSRSTGARTRVAFGGVGSGDEDCPDGGCTDIDSTAISSDGRVVAFGRPGRPSPVGSSDIGGFATSNWPVGYPSVTYSRLSQTGGGAGANNSSGDVALSSNGRVAAFTTAASNLVSGDTNGKADVFAKELWNAPVQVFRDTFTLANGAAWGAGWTKTVSNGSLTVQSGAGRMAVSNVAGAYARAQVTGAAAVSDTDLLTSFQWDSAAEGSYFNAYLRGSGGWANAYRPRNGVGVELAPFTSSVTLKRVVNGTMTTLATTPAQRVGAGKQWLRLQAVGGQVRYRIWADGTAEPVTWTVSTSIGASVPAGQLHLSLVRAGAATTARSISVDGVTLSTVPAQNLPSS